VVVMRDSARGIEVLLLRRTESKDQASGAWVFPGGLLDATDRAGHAHCEGLDDAQASALMGMEQGGLDYYVAALRECFEEAGLLLAHGRDGLPIRVIDSETASWRQRLHQREARIDEFCERFGVKLSAHRIAYHARWVTPPIRPKRWDTRFFFAVAPADQESAHDEVETVEQLWLTPNEAIARGEELKMLNPTRFTLEHIAGFANTAAVMAHARMPRTTALKVPRVGDGPEGMLPIAPEHPSWAEIGKIDPQGHGTSFYTIVPERPIRLSAQVIRVTAGNPGMMTGPGTNTYLVGGGPRNEWAVIDPGPDDSAHIDAIIAAAPGTIRTILTTHTHQDHSPGAVELARRTGAPVLGRIADFPNNQDPTFAPARQPVHGERIEVDDGVVLQAVHTPGHASNHLCFLLESERMLFTGDHIMGASTVVIGPPDGDMTVYLESLRALLKRELDWLAPGHGFLMARPHKVIEALIAHRLKREEKVATALAELGTSELDALLARVYDDVKPGLHPVARRSLTAHLIKLERDGRALREGERWAPVAQ
jgi:glyoxylase-like metal-dependent hydrolase (beta-lactamase superfamily II)/8-oxo-dGTP pyrophosphatase MutT (NUDIX family)